jgi:hypothetical protein
MTATNLCGVSGSSTAAPHNKAFEQTRRSSVQDRGVSARSSTPRRWADNRAVRWHTGGGLGYRSVVARRCRP